MSEFRTKKEANYHEKAMAVYRDYCTGKYSIDDLMERHTMTWHQVSHAIDYGLSQRSPQVSTDKDLWADGNQYETQLQYGEI